MKFRIATEILEKMPGINVAVIVLKNLRNQRKISMVSSLLRGVVAQKKQELKDEEKKKKVLNSLKQTTFGEATLQEVHLLKNLLNKITTGKDVAPKNNLLDLAHFFSLKYNLPLFGHDLDMVEQDLIVDFTTPKKGKRIEDLDFTGDTQHAVVWLVDVGTQTKEEFATLPDQLCSSILKYCGGEKEAVYLLNADMPEVDLNYVSQKEIEYQETLKQKEADEKLTESILTTDEVPFLEEEPAAVEVEAEPLLKDKIAALIEEALNAYIEAENISTENLSKGVQVEVPNDPTHGDYSTNIALKLSKQIARQPREVAEALIQKLPTHDYIQKTEIAGPGFINFHLAPTFLEQELEKILKQKQNFGRLNIGVGKKVVIDYSSPNIAKPLGVHHLLSTIIGQTLADVYRYAGYEVTSVNYLGDWGTQFGKLLYAYKNWGDEQVVQQDPLNELLKLYVQFHSEAETDPTLLDKGREEFRKLEEGDGENRRLWQWMKDLSVDEIERLYAKLGVRFDAYLPEEMYLEQAKDVIREGLEKALFTLGEKGALIVQFEDEKYPPFMVQKSDGTTLYSTRDIASVKDRLERLQANVLLYVVDVAQSLHFQQLFETVRLLGYDKAHMQHVVFGRMQLPEGKMSTRKGDIILMDEVIKEAVSRTQKLVEEKSPELAFEEKKLIAENMAVSAIKYNIISQNRETNIVFDWDRMLALDGNSGPYLEYACARAKSILRKSREAAKPKVASPLSNQNQVSLFNIAEEKSPTEDENTAPFTHPAEQKLMRFLLHFPEMVALTVHENKPNLLTNYLYELARIFSSFYNEVPVLSAGREELKQSRIKIVKGVAQTLENGLKVLGIAVFERM